MPFRSHIFLNLLNLLGRAKRGATAWLLKNRADWRHWSLWVTVWGVGIAALPRIGLAWINIMVILVESRLPTSNSLVASIVDLRITILVAVVLSSRELDEEN